MKEASELLFECDAIEDAQECLDVAAEIAFASQEAHDIDGCKCLVAIAVAFAKQGHLDKARKVADKIGQPARREYALKQIAELSAPV